MYLVIDFSIEQYFFLIQNYHRLHIQTNSSYWDRVSNDKNFVYLVDMRKVDLEFQDGSIKYGISLNTERYYMNDVTLASLLGAMLDSGYEDFVFNGFSNEKGESIGGSRSHKNGVNGDLRYLRKDKSGKRVHLDIEAEEGDPCGWKGMDESRQNNFNDALYKYGWKSLLSWQYGPDNKLLNHSKHFANHHDHLHVQGYSPTLNKID